MYGNDHSYEINPRASTLGGGWSLRLFSHGVEMGGGVYVDDDYDAATAEGEEWVASHKTKHTGSETLQAVTALLPVVDQFVNRFPRDKAAIDFAKAMLANPPHIHETQQINFEDIADCAVQLADALAARLQERTPAPAVSADPEPIL